MPPPPLHPTGPITVQGPTPDPGDSLVPTATDTVRLMGSDPPTTRSCLRHSIVLECALVAAQWEENTTGRNTRA